MIRLLFLISLLWVSAHAVVSEAEINYPIKVVATTGMIADAVAKVGGEKVSVRTLIKADPHLYQASPGDMLELSRADLIFFNGLLLEGKIAEVLAKYAARKKAIAVAELLPKKRLIRTGEFAETFDPHIWMDVSLWQFVVEKIGNSLSEFDPQNADSYRQRAANYNGELAGLHRYVASVIGSIPLDQRTLVTAHDAFQYFGRAYDMAVRGIQGVSTDSEAGLKDINVLVQFLVEKRVPAIFVESTVSPKNVEALIQGSKAKDHQVVLGGTLYSDALGENECSNYIGMIESNANTIARALGGSVPERGFITLEKIRQMHQ